MTRWQDDDIIETLVACQQIFDSTGNLGACIERFPGLANEIREYFAFMGGLSQIEPPEPSAARQAAGRAELLSQVTVSKRKKPFFLMRPVAVLGGSLALLSIGIGVSAAADVPGVRSTIHNVLENIGIESADNGEGSVGPEIVPVPDRTAGGFTQPARVGGLGTTQGTHLAPGQALPSGTSVDQTNVTVPGGNRPATPNTLPQEAGAVGSPASSGIQSDAGSVPTTSESSTSGGSKTTNSESQTPSSNPSASQPPEGGTSPNSGNGNGAPPGQSPAPNEGNNGGGNNGNGNGNSGTPPGQSPAPSEGNNGGGNNGNGNGNSGTPPGQSPAPNEGNNGGGNGNGNNGNGNGNSGTPPGQSPAPSEGNNGGGNNGNGNGNSGTPPGQTPAPNEGNNGNGNSGTPPGQSPAPGNGSNGGGNGNNGTPTRPVTRT